MAAPALARDYVYVEDVLDAMLDFESLPALSGEVLNLGTGVQTTLAEMAALVLEVTGSASEVRWDAMPPRRWDHTAWRADVSRARARLGWSPRHDLGQGLRAFLDWLDTGDPYGAVHAA
jgi:nucleoside-diphosphate-sugar epimerase